jgi:FkbM family methyltransferase
MLNKDNNFLIYGFGNLGKKVHNLLKNNGVSNLVIMDNFVQIPDSAMELGHPEIEIDNTFIIVICVWNPEVDLNQLYNQIRNYFPQNIIVFAGELTNYFDFEHFCFVSREFVKSKNKIIKSTRDLFFDQKSKQLFDELLQLRESNSFNKDLTIDSCQYLPQDLPDLIGKINDSIFCDIGAYTGDTLIELSEKIDNFKYIGFEPDQLNYLELESNLFKLKIDGYALNKATGSFNGTVLFEQGNGVSSKIVESESNEIRSLEVDIVKLDDIDWSPMTTPTVFKMDIEGAEKDTLLGMTSLIKSTKPALMVCLYHTKDDLWEIPQMIYSWRPDYKFQIRQHGRNGLETVLYCH